MLIVQSLDLLFFLSFLKIDLRFMLNCFNGIFGCPSFHTLSIHLCAALKSSSNSSSSIANQLCCLGKNKAWRSFILNVLAADAACGASRRPNWSMEVRSRYEQKSQSAAVELMRFSICCFGLRPLGREIWYSMKMALSAEPYFWLVTELLWAPITRWEVKVGSWKYADKIIHTSSFREDVLSEAGSLW